ncbi:MmgE/PrpD family protein [Chloroflexota bacterium]
MTDLAYDLVSYAAGIKYDDLPRDVVDVTKRFILDTLATTIAGSSASGVRTITDQIIDWGGREESSILIFGGKVPSPEAALVNSMMAHALDFDDTHDEAILHANVSVLPAALAVAEQKGNVSGQELITAVAVGIDVMCRLGLGAVGPLIWILSSTLGYFAATITAGKILGLDKDKLHHAVGIAYSQSAGNLQCAMDGALVKRMQPAFAARGGVLSSVMAQRGITGTRNIFEGSHGFFPVYQRGKYDRERILKDLGKVFEGKNLSAKRYPTGRYTHAIIDATINIVRENDISPDNVEEVVAHVTQPAHDILGKPFQIRESPQADAQFSIPYAVSVAIVKRDVFIDDILEQNVKKNTRVLELTRKVRIIVDQEPIAKGLVPCAVDIRTKDNKVYSQRVESIKGDPSNPLSMEEFADKFRKCARFSAWPMSSESIEKVVTAVQNLETIPDIRAVISMLTPT